MTKPSLTPDSAVETSTGDAMYSLHFRERVRRQVIPIVWTQIREASLGISFRVTPKSGTTVQQPRQVPDCRSDK